MVADKLSSSERQNVNEDIPVLRNIINVEALSADASNIPVLGGNDLPLDVIDNILDTLDQRLSKELTSIVNILKDKVKTDIINDLKKQLKKGTA